MTAANGTFTYQPAVGFRGASDSFNYQVDTSEGTSATASATIHFSTAHVWYVDNTAAPGGDGSSAAPFNSLAAVGAHAGSGDDIFVFDGSGSYTGGVVLGANQTLVGQSVGLTVGSDAVVPAAGGANPVIASSSGADVTLGDGDTVTGVTVTNTGGVGISASGLSTFTVGPTVTVTSSGGVGISATGVDAFTVGSSVTITNTGGDGLDVSGGSGTASVAAPITVSGSGNSVAITGPHRRDADAQRTDHRRRQRRARDQRRRRDDQLHRSDRGEHRHASRVHRDRRWHRERDLGDQHVEHDDRHRAGCRRRHPDRLERPGLPIDLGGHRLALGSGRRRADIRRRHRRRPHRDRAGERGRLGRHDPALERSRGRACR